MLPHEKHRLRVVIYGYRTENITSPGEVGGERILSYATTLVQELCADREEVGALQRPIIFVCHGFGGILLKRALAYSETRTSKSIERLRSIYTSTYAILFLGTPHHGLQQQAIVHAFGGKGGPSQFLLNLMKGSEILQEVSDQFVPLLNRFRIFNFWEQLPTAFRKSEVYVVEESSAAPPWDDVEKCGIAATHSSMVKFSTELGHGYRVVSEAILRYAKQAPSVITSRWEHDLQFLAVEHQREAERMLESPLLISHISDAATPLGCNQWCLGHRRPSVHFTGRTAQSKHVKENLGRIHATGPQQQPRVFVIWGLGGSGKTQFCLKYVEDNKANYTGVLWVDVSSDENAEAGFAYLGQEMKKGATFAAGYHWLSRCSTPWLLVLDNADDPDMDLTKYMPTGGRGHILITTRNPNAIMYATAGHLRFRGMDPEEAVNLLLRTASVNANPLSANPENRRYAIGIASELGYLALALSQAGAAIRSRIYTLERYLQYYLGDRKRMLSRSRVSSADEANIRTTWEVPFRRMNLKPAVEYKDAVGLAHIFAFMHFEAIPERLLRRSWTSVPPLSSRSSPYLGLFRMESGWNEEATARLRRALHILFDYSIIDYEPEKGLCSLHPVVQSWARERLDEEEQKEWLGCASAILAHCISPHLEASGRDFRKTLLPHIESCVSALRSRYVRLPGDLLRATEMEKFASVYVESGLWKQAKILQREVLGFRIATLGKRHEDTFRAQRQLAYTQWNMFELRPAAEMQYQVLTSRWYTRPSLNSWLSWPPWRPDHVDYCITLDDLTMTLWFAGRRGLSRHTGERAVKGLTKQLGVDDPLTITAMFNLARTYMHLGEVERSQQLLLWVIKRRKRFFGSEHPDTLMARNELGMCLCAQKRNMAVAERLVSNVLASRRKILGDEHAYTLWSVNDLSKIFCERRRPQEAIALLDDILPTVIRTLGKDHIGVPLTRWNMARAYFLLERWADAEQTVCSLLPVMPEAHPDGIALRSGYVFLLVHLNRLPEAQEQCEALLHSVTRPRTVTLLERILKTDVPGEESPRKAAIAQQLMVIYQKQGLQYEMETLMKRFPRIRQRAPNSQFEMMPIRRAMTGL